jgi:hypothetical protein
MDDSDCQPSRASHECDVTWAVPHLLRRGPMPCPQTLPPLLSVALAWCAWAVHDHQSEQSIFDRVPDIFNSPFPGLMPFATAFKTLMQRLAVRSQQTSARRSSAKPAPRRGTRRRRCSGRPRRRSPATCSATSGRRSHRCSLAAARSRACWPRSLSPSRPTRCSSSEPWRAWDRPRPQRRLGHSGRGLDHRHRGRDRQGPRGAVQGPAQG